MFVTIPPPGPGPGRAACCPTRPEEERHTEARGAGLQAWWVLADALSLGEREREGRGAGYDALETLLGRREIKYHSF